MKRLIICNDGTWNTPDQEENGIPSPTNVFKLYNSIATVDSNGVEQRKYYHPGVGTNGKVDSIAGGALGVGVSSQIRSAYQWIGTNYNPGDEIYIFGFSRGSFVARSLAGFLGRGLLDLRTLTSENSWSRVNTAYEMGYRKFKNRALDQREWASNWAFFHGNDACPVRCVGVWDTVGALGVPDDLELLNLFDNSDAWRFHDTSLGLHIQSARHAMAIDEIRASFAVTRWENADEHPDAKEVWFPGVHSDVGGGYSITNLSDGALQWMIEECSAEGLGIRPGVLNSLKPNSQGTLHNSYKGAFAKLRSRPRAVDALIPENHSIFHSSAIQRQQDSPIAYLDYFPTLILNIGESHSCDIFADNHWNVTGLYLAEGHQYKFSCTGEWLDSNDACDWNGTENGKLTKGDIVRAAGSLLGQTEILWKSLMNNPSTDFLGTKRVEELPWFSLVGAIANDSGAGAIVSNDGSPHPHQYVDLPKHEEAVMTVTDPGYLYCFPNDVWSLYGNNHGSVKLKITRVA
ncbi:MAG: DUF2235 domain-containing protein [Luteolibacter sp.]